MITRHMTYCLLGPASNSDLCIQSGVEISMSGMIMAGCLCVWVCVTVSGFLCPEKSLNPLNLLQIILRHILSGTQIKYVSCGYLHLILSWKLLLFIIYRTDVNLCKGKTAITCNFLCISLHH